MSAAAHTLAIDEKKREREREKRYVRSVPHNRRCMGNFRVRNEHSDETYIEEAVCECEHRIG